MDKYTKKNSLLYNIAVISIYIFLCFGYTTGSDWRNYELVYNDKLLLEQYAKLEPGFVILVRIFNSITSDFWIFNALMKSFYLYSLINFFSYFNPNKWFALAISFTFSTLFMLIDCPMRFMIAMGVFLFSCIAYLKGKLAHTIVLCLFSIGFHITMIIPILLLFTFKFARPFSKINKYLLIIIYLTTFIISQNELLYNYIFENWLSILGLTKFEDSSYTIIKTEGAATLGSIKTFILFVLILWNKNNILKQSKGELLFYMSCLYFLSFYILSRIPTGFRLSIFMGYFMIISLCFISKQITKNKIQNLIYKKGLIILLMIILCKDVYSTYKYYPYTNSCFYILTDHLPYNYRDSYNLLEFNKTFNSYSE